MGSKLVGWDGLTDLHTVQFILPHELAKCTAALRLVSKGASFDAYHQDELLTSRGGVVVAAYPPKASSAGAPAHLTLFPKGGDGSSIQAVFVSFRAADDAYDCSHYDHCCVLEGDLPNKGLTTKTCDLHPPAWQCYDDVGTVWASGKRVGSVAYNAPLAASSMADGGSILIHLSETSDVSVPLSNSYASHPVTHSASCARLCTRLATNPQLSLWGDVDANGCTLSGPPRIRAAAGLGALTINGFGRLNGWRMMEAFHFHGVAVSRAPAAGALNGYGSVISGLRSVGEAESHTRWRVMSGLLEMTSASPAVPYAIDVSELTVAWGPKRGDGTVRLNFRRVPLDGGESHAASNRPVRLVDVKTPGTWVDASDGPRVTADGSHMAHLFLQAADDNVKIDSSHSTLEHLTLVQGNVGAAIELGTYGIGLRGETVRQARASGVYVHRITQSGAMDDSLGSLLGSRTCPWGVTLEDIAINGVYVPAAPGNRLTSLVKLGTLGAPDPRFANSTNLDRWFFCSNRWWRTAGDDNQTVQRGLTSTAARFINVTTARWQVDVVPTGKSWLYNFHPNARTLFEHLDINGVVIEALDDLVGVHEV